MSEDRRVIALDTETTGFYAGRDEILSLSIVDAMDGAELFNRFYRPKRRDEWPEAQAVNHISPEMVADCGHVDDDAEEVHAILAGASLIVVYNAEFDFGFLEAADCMHHEEWFKYADPMVDFAPVFGEWDDWHEDYRWQKLATAAEYTGYEWDGDAHASLADARAAAHVWRWLDGQGLAETREWLAW